MEFISNCLRRLGLGAELLINSIDLERHRGWRRPNELYCHWSGGARWALDCPPAWLKSMSPFHKLKFWTLKQPLQYFHNELYALPLIRAPQKDFISKEEEEATRKTREEARSRRRTREGGRLLYIQTPDQPPTRPDVINYLILIIQY